MSIVNIRARIECDECGQHFSVEMDPATEAPGEGSSLYDFAEDAVRGGSMVPEGKHLFESCSVQGGKMLCHVCTEKADSAEGEP